MLFTKNFVPKNFDSKKLPVGKKLRQEKMWVKECKGPKNLGSNKLGVKKFGIKKFGVNKNFLCGLKKLSKNVWSNKFWVKIFFTSKQILGPSNLD